MSDASFLQIIGRGLIYMRYESIKHTHHLDATVVAGKINYDCIMLWYSIFGIRNKQLLFCFLEHLQNEKIQELGF